MRRITGWVLFIVIAVTLFLLLNKNPRGPSAEVPLSEFHDQLLVGNVTHVSVGSDRLHGEFRERLPYPEKSYAHFRVVLPSGTTGNWTFTHWLLQNRNGATIDVSASDSLLLNILVPLIPWLLIFAFIWYFVFRQLRNTAQRSKEPLPVIVVNPGDPGAPRA